jgi:ankyrin repeat protein
MQNDNGDTALHSAVRRGHVDVLRVLLSKNSEFSFWGMGNKIGRNAHRLAMTLNNYELMCCFFKYNIR